MVAILGTYEDGRGTFEQEVNVPNKGRVILTFLEDVEPHSKKALKLSNFSFAKTRALLKDFKGSLSEAVVEERRCVVSVVGIGRAHFGVGVLGDFLYRAAVLFYAEGDWG